MKTTEELLEKNGWMACGYDHVLDKMYYWKNRICLVAPHDDMNNVTIDVSEFDSKEVEPDFLRKILEEVEKIEVK